MNKTALVILAPGFEEIEAITAIDILRRAAFQVTVAGTVAGPITASRQTRHLADCELESAQNNDFDIIILPGGGEGTENLKKDTRVLALLQRQKKRDGWIGAICAAPTILYEQGWLDPDQVIVCHPELQKEVLPTKLKIRKRVVVSGKLITSLAAGSALEFAYAIVEQLMGAETVQKVNQGVQAKI